MKVAIGLATRGNDICPGLVEFIIRNTLVNNTRLIWKACGWSAPVSQEAIFKEAMDLEADYLLMVDSDVTPPINVLDKMLTLNKDAVSAPVWHFNPMNGIIHLDACRKLGDYIYSYGTGLEEIHSTSFSCLLLSGAVLKEFKKRNEDFVIWSDLIGKEFKESSSDVILFQKLKTMGFKLFVDWDARGSEHFCTIHLSDRVFRNFLATVKEIK